MSLDPRPDAPAGRRLTTLGALLRTARDELREAEPPPALRTALLDRAAASRRSPLPVPSRPVLAAATGDIAASGGQAWPGRARRPSGGAFYLAAGLLLIAGLAAWWLLGRAPTGPAALHLANRAALGTAFVPWALPTSCRRWRRPVASPGSFGPSCRASAWRCSACPSIPPGRASGCRPNCC